MRRVIAALAVLMAVGLVAASTGSAAGSRATVKTRHGKLGTFLVAGNGRTLYLFEKDKTSKSTCTGQCAQFWPPLLTSGKAKAVGKVRGSLLGTTKRGDGKLQVTYKGHPVYTFSQDAKPGDTKGEDFSAFGAKWYVLSTAGKKIEPEGD
jgi:predicted lipoprotein with Yx(FWY)xxD motif